MQEKILFVHVCNEGQPKIKLISTGFIALANYMQEKGIECKILNTYIEEKLNKDFNLTGYIGENSYNLICLSLQWHYQSKPVIDAARKIKEKNPDAKIILGGRTASFFAEEIMDSFNFIDFIIKGYAEEPLLKLITAIKDKGHDFSKVPNLLWRKDTETITNKLTYLPTKEILGELLFADTGLVLNSREYDKIALPEEDKENNFLALYNCGIGCPVDCSFCSGSKSCQEMINGLKEPILIEQKAVINRLEEISSKGKGIWYTSFDLFPNSDYYMRLFKKIREKKIKLKCKFECWAIPNNQFIDEFKKTFEKSSEIIISPETGSEKIRKFNKGYFYTNKELISCLNKLEESKIKCILFFTAGLPFEFKEDFVKTLLFVNFIRKRFPDITIVSVPIEIEPGSPMFMDEEKFKIRKNRSSFMDYYKLENKPDLGYRTDNFSQEEIIEAANLINIEANCKAGRSIFLKVMTDTLFDPDYFDIKEVWNLCSVCAFFKECFKN